MLSLLLFLFFLRLSYSLPSAFLFLIALHALIHHYPPSLIFLHLLLMYSLFPLLPLLLFLFFLHLLPYSLSSPALLFIIVLHPLIHHYLPFLIFFSSPPYVFSSPSSHIPLSPPSFLLSSFFCSPLSSCSAPSYSSLLSSFPLLFLFLLHLLLAYPLPPLLPLLLFLSFLHLQSNSFYFTVLFLSAPHPLPLLLPLLLLIFLHLLSNSLSSALLFLIALHSLIIHHYLPLSSSSPYVFSSPSSPSYPIPLLSPPSF